MKHISLSERKEAFARVRVDGLRKDGGWNLADSASTLFEEKLADGTKWAAGALTKA